MVAAGEPRAPMNMVKRPGKTNRWRKLLILVFSVLGLVIYNEVLIYYIVLLQCQWPTLDPAQADVFVDNQKTEPLKVMLLADTHLLGPQGHWFDKLRREWQMERAFQTSMTIHSPDVIFVLGDALDEGKWSSDQVFRDDVRRFERMFAHPTKTDMRVVVGNHDIGFHYMIDDQKRKRFSSAFSSPTVRQLNIRGNIFVTLNSMAMEGDGCNMCAAAERKLGEISRALQCAQAELPESQCNDVKKYTYSKPILLQHFPLFRPSDAACSGPDEAPPDEKYKTFKPKKDCLSQEASQKLLSWLSPRVVISGHTHFGCYKEHANNVPEWSLPSFNWRNINQPAFILARFTPNNFAVNKCYMPRETTVIFTYIAGGLVLFTWCFLPWRLLFTSRTLKTS